MKLMLVTMVYVNSSWRKKDVKNAEAGTDEKTNLR